ncbi:V-type ATPase 116kDa subunit family protein [Porphyromonas miyakawae]|uniref:V-type ATPase 116kDa subunit family protein n=2 Tax=Porphyromonas miyakawae TaxID=3137470 RepID=A0ABQ0E171_9PORP
MIEKMRKYLFMTYHREYEAFLRELRSLGVVQIKENKNTKEIETLQSLLAKRKEIETLARRTKMLQSKEVESKEAQMLTNAAEGEALIKEINDLTARAELLKQQVDAQKRDISYWSIWGDYSIDTMSALAEKGYPIRFYSVPTNAYEQAWEKEYNAVPINEYRAHTYFVTVGGPQEHNIEAEEVKAPKYSLTELQSHLELLEAELEKTNQAITDFADNKLHLLEGYIQYLDREYDFSNALIQAQDEADASLKVVEGWVPEKQAAALERALSDTPTYYTRMDIEANDNVPVKLNNNSYAKLFEPITKMYSLPNYSEIDITMLFAPFFMLFFALCLGDGGYGLLLLSVATFVKYRAKKGSAKRSVCALLQWLGGTAAVVGSLMGTIFGMVMPWAGDSLLGSVRDDYFLNQNNMMTLSIVLGLIQIILGKFIAGYKISKQKGFKYGLSTYAWALFILVGILSLGLPKIAGAIPQWLIYTMYGIAGLSLLVALFYNMPGKNIFLNLGSGLWTSYNVASGLLGDTLSYIRLFAIGLTGGILGGVFNNLAVSVSSGMPPVVNFIVAAIILLFGHGLNFGLCMISSFVHPLRLTFVEFYKNSEFEGGGLPYKPLK